MKRLFKFVNICLTVLLILSLYSCKHEKIESYPMPKGDFDYYYKKSFGFLTCDPINYDSAVYYLDKAIIEDSSQTIAYLNKFDILFYDKKDYQSALDFLNILEDKLNDHKTYIFERGIILYHLGNKREANIYFNEISNYDKLSSFKKGFKNEAFISDSIDEKAPYLIKFLISVELSDSSKTMSKLESIKDVINDEYGYRALKTVFSNFNYNRFKNDDDYPYADVDSIYLHLKK